MATMWRPSAWVDISEAPGMLILRVCGELDMASREFVEPAVLAAIASARKVELDLGGLSFCDSSGIALFIAASEKADAEGHALTIGNVQPAVARVLAVSGAGQILNITE